MTLFFSLTTLSTLTIGKPDIPITKIAGSFLLLNNPSIGYVWIMRVFLLMALVMPFIDKIFCKTSNFVSVFAMFSLIVLQPLVIEALDIIPYNMLRRGLCEIVPYIVGYSIFAIYGMRLSRLNARGILAIIIISGILISCIVAKDGLIFDPQSYKYPPESLYLIYGIFATSILWLLRPILLRITDCRFFSYLSRHSMWIYLWHIIPVYIITPWMDLSGLWLGRYLLVLSSAIILNLLYQRFIVILPSPLYKVLK